ncbi:MAG: hypothetical protein QXD13_01335 [Candidatus Pacearchaeota archaeon]
MKSTLNIKMECKTKHEQIAIEIEPKLREFEERTSLPGRASKLELEAKGGRYYTMSFKQEEREIKIEYMLLPYEAGKFYVWKRKEPEEEFTIHGELTEIKY